MADRIQVGATEPITARFVDVNLDGVTGLSPTVRIWRKDTGTFWNGSGYSASPTNFAMAAVDATNLAGVYNYDFVATNGQVVEVEHGFLADANDTDVINPNPEGTVTVGQWVDNIDAPISDVPTAAETTDAVWDEPLTGGTHNVPTSSGRRLRSIQDFGIYDMASVWVDEVAGTSTGTVDGEDATVTNRADDFDNAQTIAASVNLDMIHVQNGNTITLSAALQGYNVWGGNWTLVLNGQDISNTTILNALVSGIAVGTNPRFTDCTLGSATLPPSKVMLCSITGTITVGSAGNFQFIQCQSGVAGAGTPTVDLGGAVGATTMEFRRWSGGLSLTNVQAGDVVSVDAVSGGTITVNGTGGTVHIRGMCNVTDASGGAVSITKTNVVNQTEFDVAQNDADLDSLRDHIEGRHRIDEAVDPHQEVIHRRTGSRSGAAGTELKRFDIKDAAGADINDTNSLPHIPPAVFDRDEP